MAFITLEGLDFSGKSSALNRIKSDLQTRYPTIQFTREPGGTKIGENIRDILTKKSRSLSGTEKLSLFAKARTDHVEKVIDPAVKNRKTIISDRYIGSTYAYQVGGDKLPVSDVDKITDDLYRKFPNAKPDLTIYFKLDDDVRLSRKNLRNIDDLDKYDQAFYDRVEKAYIDGIQKTSKNMIILDANADAQSVANKLFEIITEFIEKESKNGNN